MTTVIKSSLIVLLGLAWISSEINANPVGELETAVNSNAETAEPVKTKRNASPLDDLPLQLVNSKFMKSIRDLSASGLFDGALENIIGQVTHNIQKRTPGFGNWWRKTFRRNKRPKVYGPDGSLDANDEFVSHHLPERQPYGPVNDPMNSRMINKYGLNNFDSNPDSSADSGSYDGGYNHIPTHFRSRYDD